MHGVTTRPTRWVATALLLLAFVALAGINSASAQGPSGTLTGIVSDQSKALIPDAQVILTNEGTGAERRTVTNREGFFSISAIPAGTYKVTIEAKGFAKWERPSVTFHAGDRINIPDIALSVSAVAEQVTVSATPDVVVPVDSGEKAHVITQRQIQNLSVVGRSADELLKILPGVVYTNPDNAGDPAGLVVQFNRGIGNYNVAGTRNTQIANNSDGADIIDPGCNCGSAVSPNVDMVQEVKVQTANFSAENAKGPVVFNTVSKSGTAEYHGEGYLYARHNVFNSMDWRNNFYGTRKPEDSFYFPGFNLGGPIPKSNKKMFFFAGFEWQRQNHDLGVRPAVVPTQAMRNGDFSDSAYLSSLNGYDVQSVPKNDAEGNNNWSGVPITAAQLQNGIVKPAGIDPGGKALVNMYPLPNQDPKLSGGYNYASNIINPEHRNQQLVRIDYNISDNTKLYSRFNHEFQQSPYPFTLWWYNSNDVPFPGELQGDYTTWSSSTSLVKVLSPTTTNETVFAATFWRMPHAVNNPDAVSRGPLGYPYKGVFKNPTPMLPSVSDWGGGVADMVQPGGLFDPTVFGNKPLISIANNFSKVVNTHTLKFGGFFQFTGNDEPTTNNDHGFIEATNWGNNSTGNGYADLLMGKVGGYQEATTNPVGEFRKREFSFYAQDSWKVNRRFTLEIGSRFQHNGWMYDKNGHLFGFDASQYNPNSKISDYSGLLSPHLGSNVPMSIWKSPKLLLAPRLGFAWDIAGTGNTVIRGGFGVFKHVDRNGDIFGAIGNPPLITSSYWCCGFDLKDIDNLKPQEAKPNLTVLEPFDNKMPTTYSWSFTLSKRIPYSTVFEASYVGNSSSHQTACTNCGMDLNAVPEGRMFTAPRGADPNNYRPFLNYGSINMRRHMLSQNYHSLQVTANRQTGRVNYQMAYTFSKALGVGGDSFGTPSDPFDQRGRSYGALGYDRTHIFSLAYNVLLPGNFRHPMAAGMFNGWQLSGISQLTSGAPLRNFQYSGTLAAIDPVTGNPYEWSDQLITGTNATDARPHLICDPRDNLADGQYANAACFVAPVPGKNGTYMMPYMKTPGFQNHDLSVFKNFVFTEHRKLQFRFSMYNFLNHPLPFFEGNDPGLALNFVNGVPDANTLANFGKTRFKRGRRLMQFALKFSW